MGSPGENRASAQRAHRTVGCDGCHKNQTFKGTVPACASCHLEDYQETRNPAHASAGFPTACDLCHSPGDTSFHQARFNHDQFFPRVGVHAAEPCAACHKNGVYKGTPTNCYGCHKADYDSTRDPNHAAAGFPTTCELCHRPTDRSFDDGEFNHNPFFQRVGVHASQACDACHKNNTFGGTPRTCFGCHQSDYQATKNPNHTAAGFPTTCEVCHRPTDATFNQGQFNHDQFFQRVGIHATQSCATCHVNGVYKGTPRECYGCHRADYQATKNPSHTAAGFPTTCDACHRPTDTSFNQGVFNHDQSFQRVGVHAAQPCAACHKNGVYKGTPRECFGCHQANYLATTNPNHAAAGFPTNCDACHRPTDTSFNQGVFNHDQFFQRVGVHTTQPCAACHKNNVYKGTPTTCYGCHQTNYQATTNPNHAAAGFPTTCEVCHRPTDASFNQGVFNHDQFFQRVGVHATQPCAACHKNNVYKGTPRECFGCHQANYLATKNPNHTAAGFPTTCDACHRPTDTSFNQGVFNHDQFFQRVGVHTTQPCAACHKNSVYKGTPTTCYGCHQTNYQATTNPNHAAAGFPTTCDACHRPTDTSFNQGCFQPRPVLPARRHSRHPAMRRLPQEQRL